jgi:hypothetical protein
MPKLYHHAFEVGWFYGKVNFCLLYIFPVPLHHEMTNDLWTYGPCICLKCIMILLLFGCLVLGLKNLMIWSDFCRHFKVHKGKTVYVSKAIQNTSCLHGDQDIYYHIRP